MKTAFRWSTGFMLFSLLASPDLSAQSNYWRDINSAWTNGNNWSLGHVPSTGETAAFTNVAPYAFPPTPYTTSVGRIDIIGSTQLTFNANAIPITLYGVGGIGILAASSSGHVNFNTTRFILAADQSWRNESASVLTNNGTVTNAGFLLTLDGAGAGPIVFGASSVISGPGGLTVNRSGGGTVALNSVNVYRGDTTISNGTLRAGVANALPALTNSGNVVIWSPGRLDLGAFSQTVGALNGDGTVDNTRGAGIYTLTVGYNNQNGAFSGSIGNASGLVALTKSGTGVQTLSGMTAYGGLTTVSQGTLKLGAADVIPNGAGKSNLVITTAGTCLFDLNGFNETINVPTGSGTVTNSAGSATLTIGDGNTTGTSLNVFRDGLGSLELSKIGTGQITLGGVIAMRGGITVEDGTMILGGANTYTGRTAVQAGVLRAINTAGSATGPGDVEIAAGAALQGTGRSLGSLTVNDGALLQPGLPNGACGTLTVSNMTWQGGGVYECEVTNIANSVYGSGIEYDQLVVTGAFTAAPSGKPLVLRLSSRGIALAVQTNRNYSLRVMAFATPQALDPSDVELDTNAFLASSGTWQVTNINKAIYVFQQNTAETNNRWIGSGSWSNAANWSLGRVPLQGDNVLFDWGSSAACTADAVSNDLGSLTLGEGYWNTVTFSKNAVEGGMDLRVQGHVTVQNGNHLVFTSDQLAVGGGTPTVKFGAGYTVTVANVSIATNASINADGMGFGFGTGPGGSYQLASKGAPSHGGQGGGPDKPNLFTVNLRPATYGSAVGPTSLGSGYKAPSEQDNNPGGGAIKLNVGGTISVYGRLSADAANRFVLKYPGAGGSLWITGGTLEGNGRLSANGTLAGAAYGTGGGGRIDISGTTNHFTGLIQTSLVQGSSLARGQNGSLLLPLYGTGATTTNVIGTNVAFGSSLTFTEPVVVRNGVVVTLDANAGDNTFMFSSLTIQSGGVVRCLGNVPDINAEAGGSTNDPYGLGVILQADTLTIEAGGSLNADGQSSFYGPGFYTNAAFPAGMAAGAYGGEGGQGSGFTYGGLSNITALGSGDGATRGGGALRVTVSGTFTLDGTNSCIAGPAAANRSGGSGGSLWIECGTLQGAGWIAADGGPAATSGRNAGGGGRLVLRYGAKGDPNPVDAGRVTAFGGTSITNKGAAGTVVLFEGFTEDAPVTLLALNNTAATNTSTLLNGACFGSNALLTLDRVRVKNTTLEMVSNRTLAVTTVFSNGASFVAGAGSTLAFTGTNEAAVYGGAAVAHFAVSNAFVKTVRFEAGKTNSVSGRLLLYQARLLSMTDGGWWYLNLDPATGSQAVSRVEVKDSHAGGGAAIVVQGTGSFNLGNNVNWRFKAGSLILIL
jgi:autotransporter-associated beta strand protein